MKRYYILPRVPKIQGVSDMHSGFQPHRATWSAGARALKIPSVSSGRESSDGVTDMAASQMMEEGRGHGVAWCEDKMTCMVTAHTTTRETHPLFSWFRETMKPFQVGHFPDIRPDVLIYFVNFKDMRWLFRNLPFSFIDTQTLPPLST